MRGSDHERVLSLRGTINDLLRKEEKMWHQRSRNMWLKDGYRNTKYFHSRATHTQRRNSLTRVKYKDDILLTDHDQIGTHFVTYFQELFTATPLEDVDTMLNCI